MVLLRRLGKGDPERLLKEFDWDGRRKDIHRLFADTLDRLLHHATTLNIKGESFWLKEKRKAGLVTEPVNPSEPEGDK